MAEANFTLPNDLIVYINQELCISEYIGTRAMLEEEGVIPKGMKWPDGFADEKWQDTRFDYWLRRTRPEGAKGPRRDFLHIDWWCLRFDPIERTSLEQRRILRMKLELEEAVFRASERGVAALNEKYRKRWAAREDSTFQKLLAQIPGLLPQPRGRKQSAVGS